MPIILIETIQKLSNLERNSFAINRFLHTSIMRFSIASEYHHYVAFMTLRNECPELLSHPHIHQQWLMWVPIDTHIILDLVHQNILARDVYDTGVWLA